MIVMLMLCAIIFKFWWLILLAVIVPTALYGWRIGAQNAKVVNEYVIRINENE